MNTPQDYALEHAEYLASLWYEMRDDGTYQAHMAVSGLITEEQAIAALDHMQRLFCGPEQELSS